MFKQVCLQLVPDLMQWSEAKRIAWDRVLCCWVQSLFTATVSYTHLTLPTTERV